MWQEAVQGEGSTDYSPTSLFENDPHHRDRRYGASTFPTLAKSELWPFLLSHHRHAWHRLINFQNRPVHCQPALTNSIQPLPASISHTQTEAGEACIAYGLHYDIHVQGKRERGFVQQGDSETFAAVWRSVCFKVPKMSENLLILCYQNHRRTSLVDDFINIKLIKFFLRKIH